MFTLGYHGAEEWASGETSLEPALEQCPCNCHGEEQGQLGAKVTAEPPKGTCYPSPRGLHPRPGLPREGARGTAKSQGYKYLGWRRPWPWNVGQNWGEWGWAGLPGHLPPFPWE